ncbi:MAG: hypothetical protein HDT43_12305 [Ruminococcaceae bacterium]|nr:hypothetical protein [Oscillospiraceae bacterium]
MDNIEDILRALTEDNDDNQADNGHSGGEEQGLFSGLDPEMLLKMLSLFETFNQPSDNERFLLALKPLLREENRPKIDSALRLMKLFSLLPVLRESGIFDKLL